MNGGAKEGSVVIGVLGVRPEPRRVILDAIEAAGGIAERLTEATAIAKASAVSALVFDVAGDPERLVPAAASLASAPRTRWLPRVLVVDGALAAERLTRFGAGTIVAEAALDSELITAIADVVERVRDRDAILRGAHAAAADLRALEQTLAAVQRDGGELSHDARVLFGVILGVASNLRDGFGGSVTELQHRQLVNIVEASTDAAALLDRYVTALRRLVPPSADPARTVAPRIATRRHVDLGELVRGTVSLFHGLAAGKGIELRTGTIVPIHAWCDGMQLKQALVNLVSNALKFTPAGGSVDVVLRLGPPASGRVGATARRDVEIVVSDTGPGIPERERERVFERGVRLERDAAIPGSGIGLATVRDIAMLHGGHVRIDETSGGGASIGLVFPIDLRGRTEDHAHTNGTPAPPRVRSTSIPPSSPRRTELRRETE